MGVSIHKFCQTRSRLHEDSNATRLMPHPPPTDSPANRLMPDLHRRLRSYDKINESDADVDEATETIIPPSNRQRR